MRALITGATSGIGREYAIQLAKKGYNLIITGRREKIIHELKSILEGEYGIEVEVVIADFSIEEDVERVVEAGKKIGIDMIINNAGFGNEASFFDNSYESIKGMIDVHILALTRLTRELIPVMNSGTVINVSSLASYLPTPYNNVYGGTKAYINVFTESLYLELREKGFKVQLLLPSFTYTQFHKRIGIDDSMRKNKGLIRWMKAGDVVSYSLNSLNKNKCLCIPGSLNRVLFQLFKIIPKNIYYNFVKNMKKL